MSKGSRDRTTNRPQFVANFDKIDWSKKATTPKPPRKAPRK